MEEKKCQPILGQDITESTRVRRKRSLIVTPKLTNQLHFEQFLIPYRPIFAALKFFRSIYESNEVWWHVCR